MMTYPHLFSTGTGEALSASALAGHCSICRAPLRRATRCRGEEYVAPYGSDCELFVCDECGLMQSDTVAACLQTARPR